MLGGYGMVGTAVCRELLTRAPREIQIHSLRLAEAEKARQELLPAAPRTLLSVSAGDIFGLVPLVAGNPGGPEKGAGNPGESGGPGKAGNGGDLRDAASAARRARIRAELERLDDADLPSFLLYRLLAESRPEVVVDCVNTSTGIAYGDIFSSAEQVLARLEEGEPDAAAIERLLDALYMPRLIRHVQLLYRGMSDAGTRVYVKVGTTGSGGMGLNIPYTHSEEKPSRLLLSKSALAGAQSMLLFLMGRTPGAPITKEIKPAAVIAWKGIAYGPIHRRGRSLPLVAARPQPIPATFSTDEPAAARDQGRPYENVFIDTGENGVFGLEEFIAVSSEEQAELVTPEEIARYLVFEIEGGNTGRDIVAALDGAVLGPTYRGGLVRERAVARMQALEREHGVHSVAFEMLGPPRNVKLLFEAHLLRLAFASFAAVFLSSILHHPENQ